jgi:predicted metalloprotease with PDZ domain
MKKILFCLFCFSFAAVNAQQQYQYKIDLAHVPDDKVRVQLKTPVVKETEILFSFPKVIPGSYSEKNYGRFIEDFKAFDANGKELKVKKENIAQYLIKGADKLFRIEYLVNDSWDERDKKAHIFEPGGSNIEADKNFVLNTFAFFGYLEGYKMLSYEVEVTKPDYMYGATPLKKKAINASTDILSAKGFTELADNPVLYCRPDTTSFMAANTTVNIAVYSATGKIKSGQVAGYLKPLAASLQKFFTTLPVDAYHFLFFFDDGENPVRGKDQEGGFGALEHNYCSFYYLPEIGFEPNLKSMVSDVASHEFLHILTPLNVHSEQIENFDFINPDMSMHLWLYEGVTEYFSHLIQLQTGLTNEEKFMDEMRGKIKEAEEYGDFSITEMSKNVLEEKFEKKYGSVYNKGALLAWLLDIQIIKKTNGQKNLKWLMLELAKKYGKSKPFKDEALFDEIVSLTHPDIRQFIEKYIAGAEPLPYEEVLPVIAFSYEKEKKVEGYFAGRMGVIFDDKDSSFKFTKVEKNALDINDKDIILRINNETVTDKNIESLLEQFLFANTKYRRIALTVKRGDETVELSGNLFEGYKTVSNHIGEANNPSPDTLMNRKVWMGRN